jgi:hypothetical protein
MAAAYKYAIGEGEQPAEVRTLYLIERFGVKAILNRDYLGKHELNRMLLIENIIDSQRQMSKSDNWSQWAIDNKELYEVLEKARKASKDTNG